MVVFHEGFDVESVKCPHDAPSDRRMRSNFIGLALVESSRLAENGAAHTDLPNVVKDGCHSQIEDPLFIETAVFSSQHFGIAFDAVAMTGGVCILGFNRSGMCPHGRDKNLSHLFLVLSEENLLLCFTFIQ